MRKGKVGCYVINKISLIVRILTLSVTILTISHSYSFSTVFDVTNEDELREALSLAQSNGEDDVINIAAGLYSTGGVPFSFSSDEDFSLAIEGEGAGLTILDGGEMSRVLEINTVSEASVFITIKGLTIQNGFHVSIPGDISKSDGAGIYAVSQNITIEDCEFIDNSISRAGDGGGLYADAQNIGLLGNLFSGNSAAFSGGGAYMVSDVLNLSDNQFIGNSSGSEGGGLYSERADVVSTNNIFLQNSSGQSFEGGGAAARFWLPGTVTITNNTISLNFIETPRRGLAALSIYGIPASETNVVNIYNNIVFENDIVDGVDVLVVTYPLPVPTPLPGQTIPPEIVDFGTLNIFNNDFSTFHLDTSPSGCEFSFRECILEINEGNNIDLDPLFVDAEAGDVSLQPDSPCIDAGDPDAPDVPATDIFGSPRVPPPDMGAVEFVPPEIEDLHGEGGGCSIVRTPVTSSLAVFWALPVLILMRRIVRR